ncbi:unnamed protein product [Closterium sp. Yama58-4]|nr:unnamed protein product [Closterium sp. Yama58-4]
MTPRVTDPAPAADLPFATESRTGLAGAQSAEAVAADGRTGVGLAEGKRRGGGAGACSTGAADSGDGDDVGSGAGVGVDLRLEKEPDVANIHHVSSLQGLPEDIVLLLLWRTLQRGALTERVLKVFRATQHPLVEEAVVLLGLTHHSPAPVLPTRCTDSSLR